MLMQLLTNVFAASAGASLVLSYAPFGYWFVQFPALMILLMMIVQSRSAKQAAWFGWSWGFGLFVTGVFWLRISISQFGGMTESLAIGATLFFCCIHCFVYRVIRMALATLYSRHIAA
jgi:apolipoprotein N-acyltransferase